jgi:hypothetical protein
VSDSKAFFGVGTRLGRETVRQMLLISHGVCSWGYLELLATSVTFAKSCS